MLLLLSISAIWARVALGFYGLGLAAAVAGARRGGGRWIALTRAAAASGFLFQFVSLVETAVAASYGHLNVFRQITALLALVITAFFLAVYRVYSPRVLSLLVLPLTCLLTAASVLGSRLAPAAGGPAQPALQSGWIVVHVVLICCGYAGLVLAVASGVLYLLAERTLKAKQAPRRTILPPLETLDRVGYRALLAGFPLLTAGLGIGAYLADVLWGGLALSDPTVLLALLAWCMYLVLLFARWYSGWRGRRTAYLALVCFGLALAGWFANGWSGMHSLFLR